MANQLAGLDSVKLTGIQITDHELGVGSYASVYEVNYLGLKCAGKKIHELLLRQGGRGITYALRRFEEECRLLSRLRHPNIVQFLGVYTERRVQAPTLIMEFLPTNLSSCIDNHFSQLRPEISYSILRDVALGLNYLHGQSPPIIHRDLSSNNVLLTSNMTAKISDLGVAKMLGLSPLQASRVMFNTKTPGTPAYMPPEAMTDEPAYDTSIDVFSYGVMMIHVFSGQWPIPKGGQIRMERGRMIPVSEAERREAYLRTVGDRHPLVDLILRCIDNDPQRRPHSRVIVHCLSDMVSQNLPSCSNYLEMLQQMHADKDKIKELQQQNTLLRARFGKSTMLNKGFTQAYKGVTETRESKCQQGNQKDAITTTKDGEDQFDCSVTHRMLIQEKTVENSSNLTKSELDQPNDSHTQTDGDQHINLIDFSDTKVEESKVDSLVFDNTLPEKLSTSLQPVSPTKYQGIDADGVTPNVPLQSAAGEQVTITDGQAPVMPLHVHWQPTLPTGISQGVAPTRTNVPLENMSELNQPNDLHTQTDEDQRINLIDFSDTKVEESKVDSLVFDNTLPEKLSTSLQPVSPTKYQGIDADGVTPNVPLQSAAGEQVTITDGQAPVMPLHVHWQPTLPAGISQGVAPTCTNVPLETAGKELSILNSVLTIPPYDQSALLGSTHPGVVLSNSPSVSSGTSQGVVPTCTNVPPEAAGEQPVILNSVLAVLPHDQAALLGSTHHGVVLPNSPSISSGTSQGVVPTCTNVPPEAAGEQPVILNSVLAVLPHDQSTLLGSTHHGVVLLNSLPISSGKQDGIASPYDQAVVPPDGTPQVTVTSVILQQQSSTGDPDDDMEIVTNSEAEETPIQRSQNDSTISSASSKNFSVPYESKTHKQVNSSQNLPQTDDSRLQSTTSPLTVSGLRHSSSFSTALPSYDSSSSYSSHTPSKPSYDSPLIGRKIPTSAHPTSSSTHHTRSSRSYIKSQIHDFQPQLTSKSKNATFDHTKGTPHGRLSSTAKSHSSTVSSQASYKESRPFDDVECDELEVHTSPSRPSKTDPPNALSETDNSQLQSTTSAPTIQVSGLRHSSSFSTALPSYDSSSSYSSYTPSKPSYDSPLIGRKTLTSTRPASNSTHHTRSSMPYIKSAIHDYQPQLTSKSKRTTSDHTKGTQHVRLNSTSKSYSSPVSSQPIYKRSGQLAVHSHTNSSSSNKNTTSQSKVGLPKSLSSPLTSPLSTPNPPSYQYKYSYSSSSRPHSRNPVTGADWYG